MTATPTKPSAIWDELLNRCRNSKLIQPSLFMLLRQQASVDPASTATDLVVLITEAFFTHVNLKFHLLQDAADPSIQLTLKPSSVAARRPQSSSRRADPAPLPQPPVQTFKATPSPVSDKERLDDAAMQLASFFYGNVVRMGDDNKS